MNILNKIKMVNKKCIFILDFLFITLICVIPSLVIKYGIPLNAFTCSSFKYKNVYSWCKTYTSVNITVILHEVNNIIGQHVVFNEKYDCIINGKNLNILDYPLDYSFNGYIKRTNNTQCYTSSIRNKYIRNKNIYNRNKIIIAIGVIMCVTELLLFLFIRDIYNIADLNKVNISTHTIPPNNLLCNTTYLDLESQLEIYHLVECSDMNDLCIYCLDKLGNGQNISGLACAHWFHSKCINRAIKRYIKKTGGDNFKCDICQQIK